MDWRRGNYAVLTRGGRVESPAGSGGLKKQVQMIAEGSVLSAASELRGSAADVGSRGISPSRIPRRIRGSDPPAGGPLMRYRLTCLTPLLVGDGGKLSPIDYMVWKDHVNVLDQWRIFRLLAKGPRLEGYLTQLKTAEKLDFANIYKPLVAKGYASNLQLLQSTDSATEINRLLNDAQNEVSQYGQTAAALKAQLAAYIKTWDAATSTQLVTDENDRDLTQDSLDKAQKMRDLTSLDAPEAGIVTQVGQVSKGSVQAGAAGATANLQQSPLITIMPLNAPVETELDISTQDIGFIRVGDSVTLKIDAFPYIRFGTVKGSVTRISEASYATDINGQPEPSGPFFKVYVVAKKYQLRNVPKDYRLVPGMSLTGDILVGRRTIWSYITEAAMRTGLEAMREP